MTKPNDDALYSNEFVTVTTEGHILQSNNSHFNGKQIGSIDVSSDVDAAEAIKPYTEAFSALVAERDMLLEELSTSAEPDVATLAFIERAQQAEAIGDFDALLGALPLKSSEKSDSDDTSTDALETETVVEDVAAPEVATSETADESVVTEAENSKSSEESEADSDETDSEESTQNDDAIAIDEDEDSDDEDVELTKDSSPDESDEPAEIHHDDQPTAEEEDAEEETTEATVAEDVVTVAVATFAEGDPHYPFEQLVLKGEEIARSNDWQYGNLEFDNIRFKWDEIPVVNDDAQKELSSRLQQAQNTFNERKSAHFEKMTQVRAANFDRKKELLEKLRGIVRDGRWNAINELKSLERRWDKIRQIPRDEEAKLQSDFDSLRKTFEEKRIDFLVKRKEKEEENLNVKLLILDKIDMINTGINEETLNWDNLDSLFEGLSQQWRRVGPVVLEKEDEIWDRYRKAVDTYSQNKMTFNKAFRSELEKNLKKKTALCEQAEALLADTDLVNSARTINRLHREWKEIGPVVREHSEVLWERFKKASDAFNEHKNANLDVIRDIENANYDAKEKLCEEAEALVQSNDFGKATREMQLLSNKWKDIGPVPRRKTKAVWNRFKKAMDDFFEKRRDSMKHARRDEKENYRAKKELVDKITQLLEIEDPQQAVNEIKPLQEEYQKIGFVPMKYKNKIWAKYKEACDAVYQRAREERASRSIQRPQAQSNQKRSNAQHDDSSSPDRKRTTDLQRLRKECDELQQMILHYSDTKTFIKPSKQGNKLRDDIQAKIDAAQAKLHAKTDQLDQMKRELESAKESK